MEKTNRNYVGYFLTDPTRNLLLSRITPLFEHILCGHITYAYGTNDKSIVPPIHSLYTVGMSIDPLGLQVVVVAVNGSIRRPDGSFFHITHSLDPYLFTSKDSNKLLLAKGYSHITRIPLGVTIG